MSIPVPLFQTFGPLDDGGESCERTLLRALGSEVTEDNEVWFEVRTPDVKCVTQVRVSIRCPANAGIDPNFVDSYSEEDSDSPYVWPARLFIVSNAQDRGPTLPVPTREFCGSAQSRVLIPTSADLWGYEQEIETTGGPLFGCLIVGGDPAAVASNGDPSDFAGAKSEPPVGFDWIVSARYASRVPMPEDQWRNVCAGAGIVVMRGGKALK